MEKVRIIAPLEKLQADEGWNMVDGSRPRMTLKQTPRLLATSYPCTKGLWASLRILRWTFSIALRHGVRRDLR